MVKFTLIAMISFNVCQFWMKNFHFRKSGIHFLSGWNLFNSSRRGNNTTYQHDGGKIEGFFKALGIKLM